MERKRTYVGLQLAGEGENSMSDPKALLLRAFGEVARSKAFFGQLALASEDPVLRTWIARQTEHLVRELNWIQSQLKDRYGVSP